MLEYGSSITGKEFRSMCDIDEVEVGTKAEFDSMGLQELGYADYIRKNLLDEGKYFKQERDGYRILTPSENIGQVEAYMKAADGKLKRGIKLSQNTPVLQKSSNQDVVRMMMKKESIRRRLDRAV